MMDDPAPVPTAVSNCSQGGPQVLQMTLATTTPLTRLKVSGGGFSCFILVDAGYLPGL
jgi:hypothetical protein